MFRIRVFAPVVIAAGMVLATLPAHAQSAPPAKVKRQKVDVRTMVPGPQASDAAASDATVSSGLTRDQRKEATLQARQEGTLQPAGDAAEPRQGKPLPLAPGKDDPRSAAAAVGPPQPQPSGDVETARSASDTANVATATPASTTKKGTRTRKARGANGPAPT